MVKSTLDVKSRGNHYKAWTAIGHVLKTIGAEVMSSDDSANEGGRTAYHVRHMNWRADWIGDYMNIIDEDCNHTTVYGAIRPGNPPRLRLHGLNVQGRES